MTKNLDKDGLSSIVDNYQLFYVDLWGVVHNGVIIYKEAIKALKEISKKNKDFILLTNAPRPNNTVINFLKNMGLDQSKCKKVSTSGEVALKYLKSKYKGLKFFHVGPPRDFDLFKSFEEFKVNNLDLFLDKIIHTKLLDVIGVIVIHRHKNSSDKIPVKLKTVTTKNYGLSKIIFLKFT